MKIKIHGLLVLAALISCITTTYSGDLVNFILKTYSIPPRPRQYPNPFQFTELPLDVQKLVFIEQFVEPATTVPELYLLVGRWKQVPNKSFQAIPDDPVSRKAILKKEYSILSSIRRLLVPDKKLLSVALIAKSFDSYLASINPNPMMPDDQKEREKVTLNLNWVMTQKSLEIQQRLAILKTVLSNMLAGFKYFTKSEERISFVKQLVLNGANPNATGTRLIGGKSIPMGPPLYEVIYEMDETVSNYINNEIMNHPQYIEWPSLNDNLELLKLLLDAGANPNETIRYKPPYAESIVGLWSINNRVPFSNNSHAQEINNYCEAALNLLLSHGAIITGNLIDVANASAAQGKSSLLHILRRYAEREEIWGVKRQKTQ